MSSWPCSVWSCSRSFCSAASLAAVEVVARIREAALARTPSSAMVTLAGTVSNQRGTNLRPAPREDALGIHCRYARLVSIVQNGELWFSKAITPYMKVTFCRDSAVWANFV